MLRRAINRSAGKSIALLLLAAGGAGAWIAIGVTTIVGVLFLVIAATLIAWVAVIGWFMLPLRRDANAGAVSSVEGFVRPSERETTIPWGATGISIWSYYWIVDDGRRFWVPGTAYAVLTPARHRLYFVPGSSRIVAAEPI